MNRARRPLPAVRRSALLLLAALCALSSCGIPTTGVLEAGGPADGMVPRVRIYLVTDGALVAVPRRISVPVGIESVVRILLEGPTHGERAKRMTTQLTLPVPSPTAAMESPSTRALDQGPGAERRAHLVRISVSANRVLVELSSDAGKMSGLAASQVICTVVAAQRVTAAGAEPVPVTVSTQDGRRFEGTAARCPGG